jgi:hypothetical protein
MKLPAILLALACAGSAAALDFHLDVYGGTLKGSTDSEPTDRRIEGGILADFTPPILPFGVTANGFYNTDKADLPGGGETKLTCRELQVGLIKVFDPLMLVHPFISAGPAWIDASIDTDGQPKRDGRALGGFVNGGVHVTLGLFDVGALVGWSRAVIDTGNEKLDAGGVRMGGFVGIGF